LAPEPGSGTVARVIATLRRFAWLITLVTVLGLAGSVLLSRFIEPEYSTGATIFVEKTSDPRTGPIQAPELLSSYNWIALITTFAVLDPVVKETKLYIKPNRRLPADFFADFDLAPQFSPGHYQLTVDESGRRWSLKLEGKPFTDGLVSDSVGRRAGFLWKPGPARLTPKFKLSFSVEHPRDASAELSNVLGVRMVGEQSNFLVVSLKGPDPDLIARTVNGVQNQFMTVAADLKKRKLRELTSLLGDQVRQQEAKLRAAETALESFKVQTVTQPREQVAIAAGTQITQNPAYMRYFDQRVQVETIRNERRAIEDVLGRLATGEATVDAFNTVPAVRNAPDLSRILTDLSVAQADLRALRTKYTDEYREVKTLREKIETIRTVTIPAYAQALVRQLVIQEKDLEARIRIAEQDLQTIPIRAITEARLQREMESAKVLFINLTNRYEEAKLAEISAIPDVKIMDSAVAPTKPSSNQAPRIILLGFLASLGAGIGLAILLDRLDKRFRYPEQASSELGLSILGAIPAIPQSRNGRPVPHDEMQQVIEAFRSVRLNLAHSFAPDTPICLTVSSPNPGDGKSLVAANLALSFAEAGYRTILVDGDVRRGDLHRTFAAERRPGLLDYLGSTRLPLERAFRPTSHPRLTLLPCGTRLQQGPELLGSTRMAGLITQLRSEFGVILIDSPPLGAGIDPFVLSTHSGSILIVLRSGETDRQMAEVKLRVLDRLPVRVLGAVLNHIHVGIGPYKYYLYSYGYAAEEDEITEDIEPRMLPEGEPS
jgi:capsular exopolysaccharide synthesis family protein